jgi:hypothetical protein
MDSSAPVPTLEDIRRPSSKQIRAARDLRDDRAEPDLEENVARLRAERAADADDIAKMLVRVADTERARDASELRATGLEAWTQELEEKVATARTRADEAEEQLAVSKRDADQARKELERALAQIATLEAELARVKRENEDALELERVKRGLEIDALIGQHEAAMTGTRTGSAADADRIGRMVALVEELDRAEAQASQTRRGILEQARHVLGGEPTTAPPPAPAPRSVSPTMPPTTRNAKKRSRLPPAPPLPPKGKPTVSAMAAVTAMPAAPGLPADKLETFEDLDLDE